MKPESSYYSFTMWEEIISIMDPFIYSKVSSLHVEYAVLVQYIDCAINFSCDI